MTEFLSLNGSDRQVLLENAAEALHRPAAILEKDIWVCWALEALFKLETPTMVFKGGTSLSKVYGAIQRFSEDLDITIDHRNSGDALLDPMAEGISNTKRREFSERMKVFTVTTVRDIILPHLQTLARHVPINDLRLHPDGDQILIDFQSLSAGAYVLPSLKLEFGSRNAIEPSEIKLVEPEVLAWAQAKRLRFPSARVPVLLAERTFWEKVTLIHAEITRRNPKANVERYSRHWYDLVKLNLSPIGARALTRTDLRDHVIATKTALFGVAGVNYAEVAAGACRLVPDGSLAEGLARDYAAMLEAGMFDETPAGWPELMAALTKLEQQINNKTSQDR
jgi:hypothetical protein